MVVDMLQCSITRSLSLNRTSWGKDGVTACTEPRHAVCSTGEFGDAGDDPLMQHPRRTHSLNENLGQSPHAGGQRCVQIILHHMQVLCL